MSKITVSLFTDIWGHFARTAWRMLSGEVSWWKPRDVFWGKESLTLRPGWAGKVVAFFISQDLVPEWSRCWTWRETVYYCTVWGQGLSFLTLPVTLLVADLWNSMLQGSTDTKCLVILQEKPDLFPWWKLSELHWMGQKKNLLQTDKCLCPPRKGDQRKLI